MINYLQSVINSVSIHYIPNKSESSSAKLSGAAVPVLEESLREALLKLYFDAFKEPEYYRFDEKEDHDHVLGSMIKTVFQDPEQVHPVSIEIAKHLFNNSDHPSIKSGELLVSYIDDVLIDDELLQALAIVKSENKESFLNQDSFNGDFEIKLDKGIYPAKIDKACIIFNTDSESGYKICMVDRTKPGDEAVFWTRKFLNITKALNDYQRTKVYIQATKSFIEDRLKPAYELEKADEASLLESSKSYFSVNEEFDESSYLDDLFGTQEHIKEEFQEYKTDLEEEKGYPVLSDFKVSQAAVKNQSRVFKSVIKLDKNFHIYVHGNRNMIERGTDEEGRKYYKLYYNDEN